MLRSGWTTREGGRNVSQEVGTGEAGGTPSAICVSEIWKQRAIVKELFSLKGHLEVPGDKVRPKRERGSCPPSSQNSPFALSRKHRTRQTLMDPLLFIVGWAVSRAMDAAQQEKRRKWCVSDKVCLRCLGDIPWGFPEKQFVVGTLCRKQ